MYFVSVLVVAILATVAVGKEDCIPKSRVSVVITPLMKRRSGLTITLTPDDVENLASLKYGCSVAEQKRDISFSANLGSHLSQNGGSIAFDKVLVNNGGAYNPRNGKFTCPLSGTYFFALKFLTNRSGLTELMLMINGKRFAFARAYDASYSQTSGEGAFMVNLQKGDEVYISSYRSIKLYGERSVGHTSFMGMIVSS